MLMPRRFSKERQIILCDANHNTLCVPEALPRNEQRIRLLSFNIQVGISTSAYRHYVTRSWKHLLPHQERYRNLEKIGFLLNDFDIVALQEADGGSLRSGYINQVQQLAQLGFGLRLHGRRIDHRVRLLLHIGAEIIPLLRHLLFG